MRTWLLRTRIGRAWPCASWNDSSWSNRSNISWTWTRTPCLSRFRIIRKRLKHGVRVQVHDMFERLDQDESFQLAQGHARPILVRKSHVRIEPGDGGTARGNGLQRQVQEALLLPQDIPAPVLNQDLG